MRYTQLATSFEDLEATSSRLALVQILAQLFGEASAEEIEKIVYLCQGRLAPFYEPIELGTGEKLVEAAIGEAYGVPREEVHRLYQREGDLGLVAARLGAAAAHDYAVLEVYERLMAIAQSQGPGSVERRVSLLADLLRHAGPTAAKHLVRLALGRLRLGIGDPTILEGLSVARVGDRGLRPVLEAAYNRTSDLGAIARTLWEAGPAGAAAMRIQVGKPVRPALAERLPSAQAVVQKLGACYAEFKYDGFRCQVHRDGDEVRIFSRNLEDMTAMFPELLAGTLAQVRSRQAIFEGEAVAYHPESEEYLPFQETTKRRRKHGIAEAAAQLPLRLFVFDVLFQDGEDLTPLSYRERRERLQQLVAPDDTLLISETWPVEGEQQLMEHFNESVARGLEGLMLKKPESPYQAGARNFAWVKFKRTTAGALSDTIDCVILGYIFGRGKRAQFGAGALLVGVYDPEQDVFVTVCKIGTGLSDEEWREIRARCDKIVVPHRPARVVSLIEPTAWVEPKVVIEVLADEITRSPVHTCGRRNGEPGYALRFPRLVSFRGADKRPEDATTVAEIIALHEQQARRPVASAP
ncbi:MAG: ATP-dependent DNA ligase [Chloroflexi bacterium]|nr:ATP-dependent DNA ligase [Chloroflexota bacterium]